jgi:hypothetical protein
MRSIADVGHQQIPSSIQLSTMTQITATKLEDLNVLKLYEHYGALERSLPLLTAESQDLARAELEQCAQIRSEKIDRIYYAIAAHEDALERIKKEGELMASAKKHHESQIKSLKGLINWLRRALPVDSNKITGRNYQFTLIKKKDLTVELSSGIEDWDEKQQEQFCILQETTTMKRIVVRSISGELLEEKTTPSTKTELLPNLDAIRNAYQTGQHLPNGVKVVQEYSIRTKRIYSEPKVDLDASEYFGELLPEVGSSD